jgi:hypothetical protein
VPPLDHRLQSRKDLFVSQISCSAEKHESISKAIVLRMSS